MIKTATSDNPYHLNGSSSSHLFFGRQAAFAWILEQTNDDLATDFPLVLHGPPKIGKTAVLKQIESGALHPPFIGIYLNLAEIALDSLSALYWEIANAGLKALSRLNIELDTLNHTDFIADPAKAWQQQFLLPSEKLLKDKRPFPTNDPRRLLFLFDNTQLLIEQITAGILPENTLANLHAHLTNETFARTIFAITEQPDQPATELPLLQNCIFYRLPPLNKEETVALVRQPVPFTLVQDVAQYIYHVTDGHPYKTHQLCHALYEHQQQYNLGQITVADVATVHKLSTQNGAKSLPTYDLQGHSGVKQAFRLAHRLDFWRSRSFYLLVVALVLLGASILLVTTVGNSPLSQRIAGFLGATTATPTAVPPTPTNDDQEAAIAQAVVATETLAPTETPTPTPTETPTVTPSATPTNTPTATPDQYPNSIIREQDGMVMLLIPAGMFTMGAAEDDFVAAPDER
ncbi:MAG: hypothetical protein H6656_20650, partial [Ardenticatenaceae bacterium]|nr:hypothetical protein [Ardenticatenaceae bacterium]